MARGALSDIQEPAMDIGARLRSSREARGLSLAELAARTRVQPRILSAIERNDLSGIPPKPFGRGFVRGYAHEVGLDPDATVRDYFGQFAPEIPAEPPPAPAPPARVSGFGVAVAAVVLLLIVTILIGRNRAPGEGAHDAIGTSGTEAEALPAANTGTVAATPQDAANKTAPGSAPSSPLTIVLHADRNCWVTAHADGTRVVYRLLPAGAEETVRASREVRVRAGDAGALRIVVNGRDRGPFGANGEVRVERITPDTDRR
jgi:cytoskeletal protein RodZ